MLVLSKLGQVEALGYSYIVAFSPDGRYIATGTHAGNINTWLVETGEKDRTLETKGNFVMSVAFVKDDFL